MQKTTELVTVYDPPFFLHKIQNYEKAVYERKGHWTERQKIKYGVFLEIFRHKFQDRKDPVLNKMFRVMSDFIKTRNHNQCRSHHQKMEKQRFQIDSILESIKSKYHPREYELFFEKYSRHIKAVNVDAVLNQKGFTPHKNVQKRKKIKLSTSQAKLSCEDPDQRDLEQCQRVSKMENMEQISEVLNCGMNKQKNDQNNIQLEKQKQNAPQNQISSKSKEEIAPQLIFAKPYDPAEVENAKKDDIANRATAPDYYPIAQSEIQKDEKDDISKKKTSDDYPEESQPKRIPTKKSKVYVHDVSLQGFPPMNATQMLNPGLNMNMGMMSEYMNSMAPMAIPPQFSMPQFDPYRSYETQFPPQIYRTPQSEFNYEENFVVDSKSLQEKKKWHLSEASRLCQEMNEHLQKANTCEQMMEMMKKMKQMTEPRRGGSYFYPNGFGNTQF